MRFLKALLLPLALVACATAPAVSRRSPAEIDALAAQAMAGTGAKGLAIAGASLANSLGCGCSSGVEHNLAKVGVEGSNPFARSSSSLLCYLAFLLCPRSGAGNVAAHPCLIGWLISLDERSVAF